MDFEKLLEDIFSYSDHNGLLANKLVDPLEENISMEELCERIYYECRVKPTVFEQLLALREAHLREMAALTTSQFEENLTLKIKHSIETSEKLNSDMSEVELSNSIRQILDEIFTSNNKINDPKNYSPFAVYDNSNNIMVFNGNTNHFNRMKKYVGARNTARERVKINVIYVDEEMLRKWINARCNDILRNNRINNTIINVFRTNDNFIEIVSGNFIDLYRNL